MNKASVRRSLPRLLPPLILGGAGFSYQIDSNPASLDVTGVIRQAFDHGVCAIDTSPYYEPSEQLIGHALSQPEITEVYERSDYILMTKCGRVKYDQFDYSPAWLRRSINQSLQRLRTTYLDVVFCHDVEFVTEQETIEAVGVLLEFVKAGQVRNIGLSGYRIDVLLRLANRVREVYGRAVDVIQNWAQMTLQSSRLEREGLEAFARAGVSCLFNASPMAIGLLRSSGVPQGSLGDFHPAPPGLRNAAQDAARYVESQGESLASLAIRYALWRAQEASNESLRVCTVTGITTVTQLLENVSATKSILQTANGTNGADRIDGSFGSDKSEEEVSQDVRALVKTDMKQLRKDMPLFRAVQSILSKWHDYGFQSPPNGWSIELKQMMDVNELRI